MTIEIENARPYGLISEERLQAFEKQIGISLPQDYREFLKQCNGGTPKPNNFWISEEKYESSVYQFYGLHSGPRWLSIDCYISKERYGVPNGLLPIGDDGVGNLICIGITAENFDDIFFIDHEIHPYNEPDSLNGIYKIAESFTEFLSRLR
ncbi:MAG: SMI1/KNR4 family protein [Anaerolineales bacterium]|nr:SMI1/KNR4 family protein [Anaerolineales bacterium]